MAKKKSRKKEEIYVSFVDEPASEQVTGSMVYIRTPYHQILLDAGFCQTNDIRDDYLVIEDNLKNSKPKKLIIFFCRIIMGIIFLKLLYSIRGVVEQQQLFQQETNQFYRQ